MIRGYVYTRAYYIWHGRGIWHGRACGIAHPLYNSQYDQTQFGRLLQVFTFPDNNFQALAIERGWMYGKQREDIRTGDVIRVNIDAGYQQRFVCIGRYYFRYPTGDFLRSVIEHYDYPYYMRFEGVR